MERRDFERTGDDHIELHGSNKEVELIIAALTVMRNAVETRTLLHTGSTHGAYSVTDRDHAPSTYDLEQLISQVQRRNVVELPVTEQ